MRAVLCEQWGGPETLVVREVADPVPGKGEVCIRVRAAGVNFPDVLIIQNKYQMKAELPFTPGSELAGDVITVGEGVTRFRQGDRVSAFPGIGAFAERAAVAEERCAPMPDGMGYEVAAGFRLAYGTSWYALRDRAALRAGETLLVLGAAGGVGLAAVEIGHAMGARVIAAASSPEKLDVCRARGADAVIDYAAEDLRKSLGKLCPDGPAVIYDPVGGDLTEKAFRSIGWGGRHLVIGFAAGSIPQIPANLPLLKGASLVGVFWGAHTQREPEAWRLSEAEMNAWLAEGSLRPLISRAYPLDETPGALADMAARKVVGKIVLTP